MDYIERRLKIDLPAGQSAFLWGPRGVGKSTFLMRRFPDSPVYDFTRRDLMLDFSRCPSLLREQILAQARSRLSSPIILDEVQKCPHLLDEVHWLIQNRGVQFILCCSSARKLKRGRPALLGGRARPYEMFPLVSPETGYDNLALKILNRGTIPTHYAGEQYLKSLKDYVSDYLKEEVFDAGLTRNIPAFSRFFEAMAYSHGELCNFSNVARECGIDSKTVKEFYGILVDTFLGRLVEPFRRGSRQVISKASKFFLFDVGVAGAVTRRRVTEARGDAFERAFEQFILIELAAHAAYSELNYPIRFWRTKSGLEVEFVLGDGEVAVVAKGRSRVDRLDLRAIRAFAKEFEPRKALVVCLEEEERKVGEIGVVPWRKFLEGLWEGEVVGN